MKFSEIIKQAVALLQDSGRVSYRALKREFDLDDEALEELGHHALVREIGEERQAHGRERPARSAAAGSVAAGSVAIEQPANSR